MGLRPNNLTRVRLSRGLNRARPSNNAAVVLARVVHELLLGILRIAEDTPLDKICRAGRSVWVIGGPDPTHPEETRQEIS
eukprot:5744595-Lingulodinium_polyedra.AAC.1